MITSSLYQQPHWAVQTPDVTKEILAIFKHKDWAEEWRDKHSATSHVVPVHDSNYTNHVISAHIGDVNFPSVYEVECHDMDKKF